MTGDQAVQIPHAQSSNPESTQDSTRQAREFVVPPSLAPDWLSMAEAMRELSFSRWHISNLCKDGILQRRKYGKYTLISRDSVKRFLARWKPKPVVFTQRRKKKR